MSLIIERLKEKKKLEAQPEENLTAGKLLDIVYRLIDEGKVNTNADIRFELAMYTHFICEKCNYHNNKEYRKTILTCEIDEKQSTFNALKIHITKHK